MSAMLRRRERHQETFMKHIPIVAVVGVVVVDLVVVSVVVVAAAAAAVIGAFPSKHTQTKC